MHLSDNPQLRLDREEIAALATALEGGYPECRRTLAYSEESP